MARRVAKVQPDVLRKSSGLDSKWLLLTCEVEVRDIELVLLHEVPEVRSDLSFLRSRRCRQGRAVKSEERGLWRHLKQEVVEKLKSPKLPRSKKSYEKPGPNEVGTIRREVKIHVPTEVGTIRCEVRRPTMQKKRIPSKLPESSPKSYIIMGFLLIVVTIRLCQWAPANSLHSHIAMQVELPGLFGCP